MANTNLGKAKTAKNDEFYTQYADIQNEINAYVAYNPDVFRGKTIFLPCDDPEWSNFTKFFVNNFERYGIKKLISTSYAYNSKNVDFDYQPTLFETIDPRFHIETSKSKGKIFTLTQDENKDGKIDENDLKWDYLEGDGDFRSNEIKKIRDEVDIIITNPPFSLFREFIAWLVESGKQFSIIGSMNAITYKEVFPNLKENILWLGATAFSKDMVFGVPEGYEVAPKDKEKAEKLGYKGNFTRLGNSCWYTNIEHGKRHAVLPLMTEERNIKFSKHKEIKGIGYKEYDNYDAIEIPFVDAIPSDYKGTMGVPITFLDKYNPEQFEIIGLGTSREHYTPTKTYINPVKCFSDGRIKTANEINSTLVYPIKKEEIKKVYYKAENSDKLLFQPYARILIKHK